MVPKTRHSTNFNDFCNNNNLKTGQRFSCVAFCVVAVQPLNGETIQKPDQNINTFSNGFNQFLYSPNTTTANRNTTYHLAAVAIADSLAAYLNPICCTPATFSHYISRMAMALLRALDHGNTYLASAIYFDAA